MVRPMTGKINCAFRKGNTAFIAPRCVQVHALCMDEQAKQVLARAQQAMQAKDWRWADLGRALDASDQRLNNWRSRGIPREMLPDVAAVLEVTVEWLRTGEDPKPTNPALLGASPTARLAGQIYRAPGAGVDSRIADLLTRATPKSRGALERIAEAAAAGKLTEADLELLEQIAKRFEAK